MGVLRVDQTIDSSDRDAAGFARATRVYLAGKIKPGGWREAYVDMSDVELVASGEGKLVACSYGGHGPWFKGRSDLVYAGPYFIECDHGCFHGAGRHGVGAAYAGESYGDGAGGCGSGTGHVFTQNDVVQACQRWIAESDLIFCWLDDPTAYGTIAELGYASALGKPIVLYTPPPARVFALDEREWVSHDHLADMWFVHCLAAVHHNAHTGYLAVADFLRWFDGIGGELRESARQKTPEETRREWNRMRQLVAPFVFHYCGHECVECGSTDDLTIDHRIPVTRDGTNDPWNLRPLCRSCNSRKGNRV